MMTESLKCESSHHVILLERSAEPDQVNAGGGYTSFYLRGLILSVLLHATHEQELWCALCVEELFVEPSYAINGPDSLMNDKLNGSRHKYCGCTMFVYYSYLKPKLLYLLKSLH